MGELNSKFIITKIRSLILSKVNFHSDITPNIDDILSGGWFK